MASAIELYREAYELDYRKGDWETAEEIYRKIVDRYPHSDEVEYAQVHLERIEKLKADPDNRELKSSTDSSSGGSNALSIVNFILILVILLGAGGLGYFLWQNKQSHEYNELLIQGQLNEKSGDIKNAAAIYKFASNTYPQKRIAYRFLAELYLSQRNLKMARSSLEYWKLIHPQAPGLVSFESRLKNAEASEYQNND